MARRIKSLHHNLGEKNVVFHREHRSKRGRKKHRYEGYFNQRRKEQRRKAEMDYIIKYQLY